MKKLKLFPKIFLLTLLPFAIMVILLHMAIAAYMPKYYYQKEKGLTEVALNRFVDRLEQKSLIEILKDCEAYSERYAVNLTILCGGNIYEYGRNNKFTITPSEPFPVSDALIMDSGQNPSALILQTDFVDQTGTPITLHYMTDLTIRQDAIHTALTLLPYTVSFSLLMTFLIAYVTTLLITKPIKAMVEVTSEMSHLKRNVSYPVTGQDELNLLGSQINDLYQNLLLTIDALEEDKQRIQKLEADKINFLRAASHDLKTPLTSLQILLENMRYNVGKYRDHNTYLEESLELVQRLTTMIQTILDTSTLTDTPMKDQFVPTRFDLVMNETLENYTLIASSRQIQIKKRLDHPLTVLCTKELAVKVCSNLLSNAIRYTKDGGQIELFCDNHTLYLRNECTPLTEAECSHVFEPLYRTDLSRNRNTGGNGLGLYLVSQILTLCQLDYRFVPYKQGMSFEITFPTKAPSDSL